MDLLFGVPSYLVAIIAFFAGLFACVLEYAVWLRMRLKTFESETITLRIWKTKRDGPGWWVAPMAAFFVVVIAFWAIA